MDSAKTLTECWVCNRPFPNWDSQPRNERGWALYACPCGANWEQRDDEFLCDQTRDGLDFDQWYAKQNTPPNRRLAERVWKLKADKKYGPLDENESLDYISTWERMSEPEAELREKERRRILPVHIQWLGELEEVERDLKED